MATKLKDLKITKVDFVDAGANPKANVLLYKNKDGKPGTQQGTQAEPEEPKREGMWKRFMSAIGKAVGLEPEEIDAAVDEIAKGNEAETFGEKMYEVKRRKITDEIWDLCYALQTSLCSIICDDEVKDNAQELMQTSLEQFSSTMSKSIGKWVSGKTTNVVQKSSEPASEEALKFMHYCKERIDGMIAKSKVGPEEETANAGNGITKNYEPKGEEETMIDKSLLTPAERAFFEDIEKRCSVDPAAVDKSDTKGKKAGEGEEGEGTTEKGCNPDVKKSSPVSEDIYAGLNPYVAAELQRLKKRADEADEKELAEIAKKYEIIGKKPEELVPVLKSLKNAGGSAYADMIGILDASVEAVNKSSMFTEIGKSGGYGGSELDAWSKIEKKADEIQVANPDMNRQAAIDKACQQNPQLVHEYENGR